MSRILSALRLRPEMLGGFGRALSSPLYRRYACGHVPNVFGWWANRLGIGWLTWELAGSNAWLGIVVFTGLIPVALVAPVSGVVADRYGHRFVAMTAGIVGGCFTLAIAVLALAGMMTIPLLIALGIFQGIFFGMEFPARQALIPQLFDKRENVPAALAFNATTFQVGTFLGPVIAGFLITHYGSGASIIMFAFTNFWMAIMLSTLRLKKLPKAGGEPAGFVADIAAGFAHIFRNPVLRLLFVISLVSGILLRPYVELLPSFAASVFGGGPEALGALNASAGLGALICAIFLAFRGRTGGLVRIMVTGAVGGGIGLAIFSRMEDLHVAMGVLGFTSMLLLACHVGAYSLVQNCAAPEMRGRVISVAVSISVGGPALGALLLGWLAEFVGIQYAVMASALTAIAIVAVIKPRLRRATPQIEAVQKV